MRSYLRWAVVGYVALLAMLLVALAFVTRAAAGVIAPVSRAPAVVHAPLPGHFAGSAAIVPLFHDCRNVKGVAIRGTRCPLLRGGRQLWATYNAASFAPTGVLTGDVITLQKGSQTDLASIPRLVSNIYPPDGPWVMAAFFHDLCYSSRGEFSAWGRPGHLRAQPYSRAECDELLRQGMVALGVPTFQRVTIFAAVRVGGGAGWSH